MEWIVPGIKRMSPSSFMLLAATSFPLAPRAFYSLLEEGKRPARADALHAFLPCAPSCLTSFSPDWFSSPKKQDLWQKPFFGSQAPKFLPVRPQSTIRFQAVPARSTLLFSKNIFTAAAWQCAYVLIPSRYIFETREKIIHGTSPVRNCM